MKKNILFINHYTNTPLRGGATRHYELGKRLAKKGYDVTLVGGAYHHHLKKNKTIDKNIEDEMSELVHIIWVKLPEYVNSHGIKRFLNWIIFSVKLFLIPKFIKKKPDYIYYSSLSIIGIIPAIMLSKKYKAKLVFEIRDIWPLSLICLKGFSRFNPVIVLLRIIELIGYKFADLIVTTMPDGYKHIHESGFTRKKIVYLPNGIENIAYPDVQSDIFELIKNKQANKFTIGYVGTNGVPNGVETLVLAANELKPFKDIFFTIVGDGPEKKRLIELSKHLQLTNIYFADRVPSNEVHQIVSSFDIVFHGQSIITKLYDYGISPNKMSEYFLQGKPVVNAYSGSGDPVSKFGCGITVPALDFKGVSEAILEFKSMSKDRFNQMSINAKKAIDEFYDYDMIASSLDKELRNLN
jgi:glycosyltransferase involved in cell wall biosynthesis